MAVTVMAQIQKILFGVVVAALFACTDACAKGIIIQGSAQQHVVNLPIYTDEIHTQ
jgi:hypothetical protein